jgi:hypothetical protein
MCDLKFQIVFVGGVEAEAERHRKGWCCCGQGGFCFETTNAARGEIAITFRRRNSFTAALSVRQVPRAARNRSVQQTTL